MPTIPAPTRAGDRGLLLADWVLGPGRRDVTEQEEFSQGAARPCTATLVVLMNRTSAVPRRKHCQPTDEIPHRCGPSYLRPLSYVFGAVDLGRVGPLDGSARRCK